jgi:glycosyltransferase involved in cell wall biosynthesis
MSELLGNEDFLVEPGDVDSLAKMLLNFIEDVNLRKRISEAEYNRARELFNTEVIVKQIIRIYQSVLK